jgi:hypothetical protein
MTLLSEPISLTPSKVMVDYGEMLEKLVVQLAAEKKSAIEHAVTISHTTLSPRVFMHSQAHKPNEKEKV